MIKLFIHAGHGGSDRGAIGINGMAERDCNIKIRDALLSKLKQHDEFELFVMSEDIDDKSHGAYVVSNAANGFGNLDLAIDIHCNYGGGNGFEIWVGKSGLCDGIAVEFCDSMKSLGNVRGIKTKQRYDGRDSLYFIRDITCPSCVLETAFIDNEHDSNLLRYNIDLIANSYYNAICDYFGVAKKVGGQEHKYFHVQVGAFEIYDNAVKLRDELISKGYNCYIKGE